MGHKTENSNKDMSLSIEVKFEKVKVDDKCGVKMNINQTIKNLGKMEIMSAILGIMSKFEINAASLLFFETMAVGEIIQLKEEECENE